MHEDFMIDDELGFTDEDEKVLEELRSGVAADVRKDPVTGRVEKRGAKNALNKRKLSKQEMDEIFLDF